MDSFSRLLQNQAKVRWRGQPFEFDGSLKRRTYNSGRSIAVGESGKVSLLLLFFQEVLFVFDAIEPPE
jgi:hypothetical protein